MNTVLILYYWGLEIEEVQFLTIHINSNNDESNHQSMRLSCVYVATVNIIET